MKNALKEIGFSVGNQAIGEVLGEDFYKGDYSRLFAYCHTADAFQDFPFMIFDLVKSLDAEFPNSKFILTVRNNSDQWFNSLVNFHSKLFSSNKGLPPSSEELAASKYIYQGYVLKMAKLFWDYPEVPLYSREEYITRYENYNKEVRRYFGGRYSDFIEINVSKEGDFGRLLEFLDVESSLTQFPWSNKT